MSENIREARGSFPGQQNEHQTQNEEHRSSMEEEFSPRVRAFSRNRRTATTFEHDFTLRGTTTHGQEDNRALPLSAPRNEEARPSSTGVEIFSRTRAVLNTQLADNDSTFGRATMSGLGDDETFSFPEPRNEEEVRGSSVAHGHIQRTATQVLTQRTRDNFTFRRNAFSGVQNAETDTQNEEAQGSFVLQEPIQGNRSAHTIERTIRDYHNTFANSIAREEARARELSTHRDRVSFQNRSAAFTYDGRATNASRLPESLARTQESFLQDEEHTQDEELFTTTHSSTATGEIFRRTAEQDMPTDESQSYSTPLDYFERTQRHPRRRVRFDREHNLTTAPHLSSTVHRPSAETFRQMMHPVIGGSQADFTLSPFDRNRPHRNASRNEGDSRTADGNQILNEREETRLMIAELQARHAYRSMGLSQRRNQHSNDVRLEVIKGLLIPATAEDSDCCPICREGYAAAVEAPAPAKEVHSCPHCREQYITTPNNNDTHDPCSMPVCSHVFGRGCITQWLKDKYTCPMCRAKVSLP